MKKLLLLLICLTPFSVSADADSANYRLPEEMTRDDWDVINTAHGDYRACLQEKMIESAADSDDPRVISNQVLELCSIILIKLDQDLGERNINPIFTQRYIYNMKNKAAQKLLRNLMMMIASRQQEEAEAKGNDRDGTD